MLAGDVDGRAGGAYPSVRRRHIDDAPAPLRQHHPQFVLHAQQHTQNIAVERGRIALRSLFSDETAQSFRSRVIDGNIQASETLDGFIHKSPHVVFVADVRMNEHSVCAELQELGNQRLALIVSTAGDDDLRRLAQR